MAISAAIRRATDMFGKPKEQGLRSRETLDETLDHKYLIPAWIPYSAKWSLSHAGIELEGGWRVQKVTFVYMSGTLDVWRD